MLGGCRIVVLHRQWMVKRRLSLGVTGGKASVSGLKSGHCRLSISQVLVFHCKMKTLETGHVELIYIPLNQGDCWRNFVFDTKFWQDGQTPLTKQPRGGLNCSQAGQCQFRHFLNHYYRQKLRGQSDAETMPATGTESQPQRKKRPHKTFNLLQAGIQEFLNTQISESQLSACNISLDTLPQALPKRFTIYEPLLLLPANAFNVPPAWSALYTSLTKEQRQSLYASIAKSFARMGVSHIAINAPIALTDHRGQENRMRSPAGLILLHGDFGDISPVSGDEKSQPSASDLERAFWVRTAQNHGIVQIWAPLYTMFSRGNITEKSRILGQGPSADIFEGLDAQSLRQSVTEISVVDLYAGIGYFVFSYLRRGVKRVWGWELNGWSVEGLRRGCLANKWGCKVVKVTDDGKLDGEEDIEDLVNGLTDTDRVVIFHGDNRFAADMLDRANHVMNGLGTWNPVRHVNLGLLPSSQPSWENACRMLDVRRGGWIHVHENVDVHQIEQKKKEIEDELARIRSQEQTPLDQPIANCRHVEHVKTYAPGVMHCVFDVRLSGTDSAFMIYHNS